MRIRTIHALLTMSILAAACATPVDAWDKNANGWIGLPLAKLVAVYGEPVSIKLDPSGDRALRYELREIDPTCRQTWVVDKADVIVAQYHSGRCRG